MNISDNYPSDTSSIPWLTHNVWKDLKRLETFNPFTSDNLSRHILSH